MSNSSTRPTDLDQTPVKLLPAYDESCAHNTSQYDDAAPDTVKTPILSLPDEILGDILIRVGTNDRQGNVRDPKRKTVRSTATLLAVCSRFRRIATPSLYAHVHAYTLPAHDGEDSEDHRHRSVSESAWLKTLPLQLTLRGMALRDNEAGRRRQSIWADYAAWFTECRSFQIFCNEFMEPYSHELVMTAIQSMPQLAQLKLMRVRWSPRLFEAVAGLSSLQSVQLKYMQIDGQKDWGSLGASCGTSHLNTLSLMSCRISPNVLENLIKWSSKLENLVLWGLRSIGGEENWSFRELGSVIVNQRAHLNSLEVLSLPGVGLEGFEISDFSSLETLTLAREDTGTSTECVEGLVAPNLRNFYWKINWDPNAEGVYLDEPLHAVGQKEVDWLRAFASVAIRRRTALRRIRVEYFPSEWNYQGLASTVRWDIKNSWDYIDSIADEIRPEGIDLQDDRPAWLREKIRSTAGIEKNRPMDIS